MAVPTKEVVVRRGTRRKSLLGGVLALALTVVTFGAASSAGAQSVRGFDGETITVAGMGIAGQFPGAEIGAKARIERFNETDEIEGIQIDFAEFVDDEQDTTKSLQEARRLVTQVGVFAIVGDVSATNPGEYFAQEQVPYFGWAFDASYCSSKPTTDLWGFGFYGCIVTSDPSFVNGWASDLFEYAVAETGKKRPTIATISNDNDSGKNTVSYYEKAYKARGFKTVSASADLPMTATDYTPYVQNLLTADGGKAPDVIQCGSGLQCIDLWRGLEANGYDGIYWSALYSDALVTLLEGTVAGVAFHNLSESNPGLDQLEADVEAVSPGYVIDSGTVGGYASTDMFITVLKKLAKKGTDQITPANVQKVASKMTWEMEGVAGPTQYPDSTVVQWPYCQTLMKSDGTAWETVVPYECWDTKTKPKG